MGLVRKAGGAQIPPGEKLRFSIVSAEPDEGDHGPQAKFRLKVLEGPYKGEELTDWAKVGQDEKTGEEYIADGGKLFNIAACAFKDPRKLDSFDSIDDLIEALEGKSFVSVVKQRGKYVGLTWDMIYVDDAGAKKRPNVGTGTIYDGYTKSRSKADDLTEREIAEMNYALDDGNENDGA